LRRTATRRWSSSTSITPLYAGDSGRHLIRWLVTRSWWRSALAVAAAPLLAPLLAFLPTRRAGVSGCLWLGTVGLRHRGDLDALIRRYVASDAKAIRLRLLPIALETLQRHRRAGDNVVSRPSWRARSSRSSRSKTCRWSVPRWARARGP
jgi:phosphatidylglycerophosphatase C